MMRRIGMDIDNRALVVEFCDGRVVTEPAENGFPKFDTKISRFVYDLEAHELELRLLDQDVTIEVGSSAADTELLAHRPIVYLDQLHWITLARQLWAPAKVPEPLRAAAKELVELARSKKVVLPLSAAHYVETARTDGRYRRHLAGTMLDLSRGWQMRNPVRVRHLELKASLEGCDPVVPGVFTLNPHETFVEDLRKMKGPPDAPQALQEAFPRLVTFSAIYDMMVEDEKASSEDAKERATAWAASHQKLADYLRSAGADRQQRHLAARARVLADLSREVAVAAKSAGLDPLAFDAWLSKSEHDELGVMPYLGRLEEVTFHRLSNADDRWEPNDLHDMHFLSCAAGYADIVVGENQTTDYLRRAERSLPPRAYTCATLPQAVAQLHTRGI